MRPERPEEPTQHVDRANGQLFPPVRERPGDRRPQVVPLGLHPVQPLDHPRSCQVWSYLLGECEIVIGVSLSCIIRLSALV